MTDKTHAEKLQLLRDLAEKASVDHERTKATLAWFTAWMAARYGVATISGATSSNLGIGPAFNEVSFTKSEPLVKDAGSPGD